MNCETAFLLDYVSLQRGTTYKGDLVGLPGPVLLGLSSIASNGGFRHSAYKTYGGECPEKITLHAGDLFVSLKDVTQSGDLLGSVARVPKYIESGRLTQDTVKLIFNEENPISRDYIYWLLRTPEYREYCRARCTGTTTLGLSRDDFLNFPVPTHSQNKESLVVLLESIEESLSLLQEINQNLEAIAQAIFKSWFVDFDPVKAKAAGLVPGGIDKATAALFPDSFVDSDSGSIPAGWSSKPIGDVASIVGGSTPDTKNPDLWEPAEFNWTSPKDLSGLQSPVLLDTDRKISAAGLAKISSGLLPAGTLLLSSRAPIGYLAISQIPIAINQGYIAMPPGAKLPPLYLYFWCKQNMEEIKSRSNGSTFMEISKSAFRPIPAVLPPPKIIEAFMNVAGVLFEEIVAQQEEIKTLSELRDTLLPRLISGKLRLPEITQEAVEMA